jgi:hypothetical protein
MGTLRIARSRARPAEYADALAEATDALQQARDARDYAEEAFRSAQNNVLTIMASAGITSSAVTVGDQRIRVTAVRGERLEINEEGLRKAVTAPVFDKLCDLKLNRNKLETAIAEGRVDPVLVASFVTHKESTPYVRLTVTDSAARESE